MSDLPAQPNLHLGMSAEEFRKVRPGVLPEEAVFSGSIGLEDTIKGIPGTWNFSVHRNRLVSAQFHWSGNRLNEEEFRQWLANAHTVQTAAVKAWGAPMEISEGELKYHPYDDVQNKGMEHAGRELAYDMAWYTATNRIQLSCDFRSNYYPPNLNGNNINGPIEMYSYQFAILFELVATQPHDNLGPNVSAPSPINEPMPISAFSPENVRLGMSMAELKAAFPRIKASGTALTGQFQEEGELKGLKGSWIYEFEEGSLRHWGFSHYEREISEAAFNKCLAAADALVADQTKLIGKPESLVRENTQYIDPSKKHHWGYKVLNAKWIKPEGATTEIRFQFFGGKGDYFFVVEATQQQK